MILVMMDVNGTLREQTTKHVEITILKTSKPESCAVHVEVEMILLFRTLSNVRTRMLELQTMEVINVNGMVEVREIYRLVEFMMMPTLMLKIYAALVEEAKKDLQDVGFQILIHHASFNLALTILRSVLSNQRLSSNHILL